MEYLSLFDSFDSLDSIQDPVEINKPCCSNQEIRLDGYNYVCINCGCVVDNKTQNDDEFNHNTIKSIDIFNENKSTNIYANGGDSNFNSITRITQWNNYSYREATANKCYGLIEDMLKLLIPNFKANNCLGEKILTQAKLMWRELYIINDINTRGEPRKCLFMYCIIKGYEQYDINIDILKTFKIMDIKMEKYNTAIKSKVEENRLFANNNFKKFYNIIIQYRKDVDINDLIIKYNENKLNKLERKNNDSKSININDNSMLKAITYKFIRNYVSKPRAVFLLDIASSTLNKAMKLIV